jgi:hypothetical protein
MERRIRIVIAAVLALPLLVPVPPAYAQARGTPCHISPDRFALEFFHELETVPLSPAIYEARFAAGFKRGTPYNQLRDLVVSTHRRFGLDKFDKPVELRLVRPPSVQRLSSEGSEAAYAVGLSVYSARGRIGQRVQLVCEKNVWKVIRFSYEPERD